MFLLPVDKLVVIIMFTFKTVFKHLIHYVAIIQSILELSSTNSLL